MKKRLWLKLLSITMAIVTIAISLPLHAFAQTEKSEEVLYLKEIRLAQAETREEAKISLENDGYIFFDNNLNEGTDEDGIWLGYKTTADPMEAIYDMRLMNMDGGFTLTAMDEIIHAQETAFAEMASDLEMLIKEFVEAYKKGYVPAKKAYMALNFFRMVENETELEAENGLGYQLVYGGMNTEMITEMIMFCNAAVVDSIVKILTMGIQAKNDNWMKKLSALGPYNETVDYGKTEDDKVRFTEDELERRAEQLETTIDFYANAYNAFDKLGLVSGKLDENFNITDATYKTPSELTPDEHAAKNADESRYKLYKVVFDEMATYAYGTGKTLKDFFKTAPRGEDLYPLVASLSDGEYAALSYGCFLEVGTGASAVESDFDCYDEVFAKATEEVDSLYLYMGVDKALLSDDSVVGFTDTATRHMAATGELEFFENKTFAEESWEKGIMAAKILGATGLVVMGVAKVTMGVTILTGTIISAVTGSAVQSAVYAGVLKVCSILGGPWALLITVVVVAVTVFITWLVSIISEEINGTIDWDDNPMPDYLYDVREVGFTQKNENEGIATDYIKRPTFCVYESVRDENGQTVDLNARSKDASQWIGLYVSYERLGDDAKPIMASELKVKYGNGETPKDYKPLTRFDEVIAYDLNQWDEDDEVNGIYMFYKQDEAAPPVKPTKTHYISEVYLQSGESEAHCIALLEKSGYTPLNVNLSPDYKGENRRPCTYIGYKTTTHAGSAIRDIRVVFGPSQGEIMMGAANYAECGSNGDITLYNTKYLCAGTPILAGSLQCVNDRSDAPVGYEPVCLMSGGPAVSFNTYEDLNYVKTNTIQNFLYFLPEISFTEGPVYLGNVAMIHTDPASALAMESLAYYETGEWKQYLENFWSEYGDYEFKNGTATYTNTVAYYPTRNPYRAIYGVKASTIESRPDYFTLSGKGYSLWSEIWWSCPFMNFANGNPDAFYIEYNGCGEDMGGTLYLSGNPSTSNLYADGKMSETEPLGMADLMCLIQGDSTDEVTGENSPYVPVTDVFTSSQEPAALTYNYSFINTYYFTFYAMAEEEQLPYVTSISVADELTIFRKAGGSDAGIRRSAVTDAMLYKQLAAMGANNFCGHRVVMNQRVGLMDCEVNALLFGYTRSAEKDNALTDMFIYVNDFSFDDPPKSMMKGNIEYKLICEVPYNLTGYEEAPGPGIWIYGTTSKRAGNPITDFKISDTPFMNNYETVRTKNNRSPWSEIRDLMEKNEKTHFLDWAQECYSDIKEFFSIVDNNGVLPVNYFLHTPYYLHIQREGDSIDEQKPYIGGLYLTDYTGHKAHALETLFDKGADAYMNTDLNCEAGGKYILLGYSRTESIKNAIKDISAYHETDPQQSKRASDGRLYTLVSDLDLNKGAGGDYIYMYATKEGANPIRTLDIGYQTRIVGTVFETTGPDGKPIKLTSRVTNIWGTNVSSNLNADAGGRRIYLFYWQVTDGAENGSYTEPVPGTAPSLEREGFDPEYADPNGKYIGEIYVMDLETLRQEQNGLICYNVSEEQVFNRLREMGATEIIKTPIRVNSRSFGFWNDNKVYIGYSRTNDYDEAIRDIVIHVELMSFVEPKESMAINKKSYQLVAEAATGVTSLPKAINLLSFGDGKNMAFPKMYLYKSTAGNSSPLTDICIDQSPLVEGWNTVRSSNGIDPYLDARDQAHKQYLLADKDDDDSFDSELIYTDPLFEWMDDLSAIFEPEEENITPYYIHTKNSEGKSIEEEKPYIEEVYLAAGDTKQDALTQLAQFNPDGFVDIDLNQDAGGMYVYLAYKRTDDPSDAIRDLMICKGSNPEPIRRVDYKGIRIRYDLVADVDLNAEAGGPYLYLYASKLGSIGNPVLSIEVIEGYVPTYSVWCGRENMPVYLVEDNQFTGECIDLNKGAGGDYLYMYMVRETTKGHMLIGLNKRTEQKDPTCSRNGYDRVIETCLRCSKDVVMETVIPATGIHVDAKNDGDHRCDVCRKRDISNHIRGEAKEELRIEATCGTKGSYHERVYCTDCEELLSDKVFELPLDPDNHMDAKNDGDHNCDYCGALNVTDHVAGKIVEENRVEPTEGTPGSCTQIIYCKECGEKMSEEEVVIPSLSESNTDVTEDGSVENENEQPSGVGSLIGEGSVLVLCILTAAVVLVIFLRKKK